MTVGVVMLFDYGQIAVSEFYPERLGLVCAAQIAFLSGTPPAGELISPHQPAVTEVVTTYHVRRGALLVGRGGANAA
jgi:hypothetical protein